MSLHPLLLSPSRLKRPSPSPDPDTNPRPLKVPRTSPSAAAPPSENTSPLRRTESYMSFASLCAPAAINPPAPVPLPPVTTMTAVPMPQPCPATNISASSSTSPASPSSVPYTRTLRYYKEQRERSKALIQSGAPPEQDPLFLLIANALISHQSKQQQQQPQQQLQQPQQEQPSTFPITPIGSSSRGIRITRNTHFKTPLQQFPARLKKLKQRKSVPRFRPAFIPVSSPLAPRPSTSSSMHNMRPIIDPESRPMIPRARRAPDLYRLAIKARMRQSKEGQQLLSLGPRLACKLGDATKELEKLVATENGQLVPLQPSPQRAPLRPLVRTESYADLSMFIQPPTTTVAVPSPSLTPDVHMASDSASECDEEDWEMLDFTS